MPDGGERHSGSDQSEPLIRVEKLRAAFGSRTIFSNVSFEIRAGEVIVIVGDSGCGKSTLLMNMIGLYQPAEGKIEVAGFDVGTVKGKDRLAMLRQIGVAYQSGALFGSMTLRENIRLPLEEFTDLPNEAMDAIALGKLNLVGLAHAAELLPSEVSGGMQKRAAIARAMALDPKIIFLDEPSAGLDPITSAALDSLILELRKLLGMTFVVVSHELASIYTIADRCIVLQASKKTMVAEGPPAKLRDEPLDDWMRAFFNRETITAKGNVA
ncbi:MAG: ABC transporter ATP-binding protein [Phycisphaerales bacterium]